MFENLSDRLSAVARAVSGTGRLTEENIKDSLRSVRMALLEADVALPVVKAFIQQVSEKAAGIQVIKSLNPGQTFIKIVNDELIRVMGVQNETIVFNVVPPLKIMVAGLQGAGKTTTVAKLARLLKEKYRKKVLVSSCDVYRPAAINQLELLAQTVGVDFYPSQVAQNPVDIATNAISKAKTMHCDVVIIDTAGRLHIDSEMMSEIQSLHKAIAPHETLFVADSMLGQDAVHSAKAFDDAIPLTGVILTKVDGDARGGAALSIRYMTGKPIKFLGVGEKTDKLEPFYPERMASRILGMGDMMSLIEQAQDKMDMDQAAQMTEKLRKGSGFDLEDMKSQLQMMDKMGGMGSMMELLPGAASMAKAIPQNADKLMSKRLIAMINSMTPGERKKPDVINGSRKRRIAAGSGTQIQDINRLLKQYKQMSEIMKKFSKGGIGKAMKLLKGKMPKGMEFFK